MHIAIRHEADLLTLALHQPAFGRLVGLDVAPMAHRRWVRRGGAATGRDMHILHVAFIGKSGYGKSSLINAIVGRDVLETSAIEACTQDAQNASFRIAGDQFLSFADVPGIGESTERDSQYLALYDELVAASDVVVHVLRADCRDYAIDLAAFERLFPRRADRRKVILALNGCDKIEPLSRKRESGPSEAQLRQVQEKLALLGQMFPGVRQIVPCCATPAWNLASLTHALAELLAQAPGVQRR